VTFRVGPTRHVSSQPIDQIFKRFAVHRPTYPALTASQTQCWRIYVALSFRAEQNDFIGNTHGETFQLYVEKVLVPTLRHGDIVIMDNLGSHRGKAVRLAIRAAGARLFFLPKYSPDLNPIEQFFAKLKHWLRKAAKRTIETVYDAIGPILDTVTSAECANYFTNAGYDQT
jgi:transposase